MQTKYTSWITHMNPFDSVGPVEDYASHNLQICVTMTDGDIQ